MTLTLVMADAAKLSFVFTSFVELPTFVKVDLRYCPVLHVSAHSA